VSKQRVFSWGGGGREVNKQDICVV